MPNFKMLVLKPVLTLFFIFHVGAIWGHGGAKTPSSNSGLDELTSSQKEVLTHVLKIESTVGTFDIEFHARRYQMPYVARLSEILRRDASKLVEYFGFVPEDTVHIKFNDGAIRANGFATVFPYNIITLNPIPPLSQDALAENSDWSRGLLLHELTHIVHMDLTRGILKGIRTLFGSLGKLGGIVPRWFSEGVAVWAESHFTTSGRLQSQLIDYELDGLYLDDNFCQTIDCLDQPGLYPSGQHPYWIGSRFLSFIEKKKEKSLSCLIQANSDSIPFFLNSAFEECLGMKADVAFSEFRSKAKKKALLKIKKFRKTSLHKKLTPLERTFGAPVWQNNSVLMDRVFWRQEANHDNQSRLVRYKEGDSNREEYYLDGYFEGMRAPTAYSKNRGEILFSFLELKGSKRVWKVWGTKEKKLIKTLDVGVNSPYLFQVGSEHFYYLSFKNNRWELWEQKADAKKRLVHFPSHMDVYSPRVFSHKGGHSLGLQTFNPKKNGSENYSYNLIDLNPKVEKKLWVLYQDSKPFQYMESCKNEHLIKQKDSLIITSLDKKSVKTYKSKSSMAKNLIQMRMEDDYAHLLFSMDPKRSYLSNEGCSSMLKFFKKKSNVSKSPKAHRRLKERVKTIKEEDLKTYPSLSHFAPKYWLLNIRAGDSASSVSASTVLSDPRNHHAIGLGVDYYFDLEEMVPSGSYTYNGDVLSYGLGYSKSFTTSSFSTTPNSSEVASFSIGGSNVFGHSFYNAKAYISKENARDFISTRQSLLYGLTQNLERPGRGGPEAFFQNFSLLADISYRDVENGEAFIGIKSKGSFLFRLSDWLYTRVMGTYGKLDKFDFRSGVLFGGGDSSLYGVSFHEFYGLNYSDAFGNEIITGRFQFDLPILDIFRGSGLFPVYFKTFHLLAGMDVLKADRILIKNVILGNEMVHSFHGGASFDLTLAYLAPLTVDLIYTRTFNDFTSSEDSFLFLLKGSFF